MQIQVSHTQIILIQFNFLHYRRHHEGESLSVEVVQRVAHKHGQKYSSSVVFITCSGHGCKSERNEGESRGESELQACDRLLLSVTVNFDPGSTAHKVNGQLLHCTADLLCIVTVSDISAVNDLFSPSRTQQRILSTCTVTLRTCCVSIWRCCWRISQTNVVNDSLGNPTIR